MIYSPVITDLNRGAPHVRASYDIYDMDHSTDTDSSEIGYWDYDGDKFVSDDERDEDARRAHELRRDAWSRQRR